MHNDLKLGYDKDPSENNNVCAFLKKHLDTKDSQPILSWVTRENIQAFLKKETYILKHDSIDVRGLYHLVDSVAFHFSELGIKKGDRSILFVPMSLNMYVAMFALQKIGAIPVFLDSWARKDQLKASVEDVAPNSIISFEQAYEYLNSSEEIQNIPLKVITGPRSDTSMYSADLDHFMQTPGSIPIQAVEKEHTALITFTTGSSGRPKGANRTHRFLAAQHYALNRHLPYKENDKDMPVFPIFSLNNLASGVHTILPAIDLARPSEYDAFLLYSQLMQEKINCTTLSPSLLNNLSAFCLEKKLKLTGIERMITGGAPVSNDNIKNMQQASPDTNILVLYGSTEVEPMAHISGDEMLAEELSEDSELVLNGVNVGRMDQGLRYEFIKITKENIVLDKTHKWSELILPTGEIGELIVSGEHVCEGYYNNTQAFLKAKLIDSSNTIWHRTGDLGYVDKNKSLWLVGRVHNAIKTSSGWAYPVKAEIVIKKCPGIKHAAYLGIARENHEEVFCIYSCDESQDKNKIEQDLVRLLKKNNIYYDHIKAVDNIPLDPRHHSKVEYEKLKSLIKAQ